MENHYFKISSKFKVIGMKKFLILLDLFLSYRETLGALTSHKDIAYALRVCHEFDHESVVQVQAHLKKNALILSRSYLVVKND